MADGLYKNLAESLIKAKKQIDTSREVVADEPLKKTNKQMIPSIAGNRKAIEASLDRPRPKEVEDVESLISDLATRFRNLPQNNPIAE